MVVKKAKKCLTEEKKGKTQPTLVFPPVSLEIGWKLVEIGGLESVRICETFRLAEIDVLINADETFLRFYPEEEHVIAPKEPTSLRIDFLGAAFQQIESMFLF